MIAESYERMNRSNLVGMGVLPLQFLPGQGAEALGLTGQESYTVAPLEGTPRRIEVRAVGPDGTIKAFETLVRIDTPNEWAYYHNGGILHFVLRRLAAKTA